MTDQKDRPTGFQQLAKSLGKGWAKITAPIEEEIQLEEEHSLSCLSKGRFYYKKLEEDILHINEKLAEKGHTVLGNVLSITGRFISKGGRFDSPGGSFEIRTYLLQNEEKTLLNTTSFQATHAIGLPRDVFSELETVGKVELLISVE
jgi:hypothetical protein